MSTTEHYILDLKRDEGLKLKAYQDTVGLWTIGYGHHDAHVHEGMVITQHIAEQLLIADAGNALQVLDLSPIFSPWWRELEPLRQDVIAEMNFNMGLKTFLKFQEFISACRQKDFARASAEGLDSLWAKQVKGRASRLMSQLERNEHVNSL